MTQNGEAGVSGSSVSLKVGSTDSQSIKSLYDDWAETYDATVGSWDYEAPNDAAKLLVSHLQPGARILDVGCGTGLVSEALKRQGVQHIEGTDISDASLKRADQRGTYEKLVRHDLQKLPLPFADKSFDGAISVGVLTYIEDPFALFRDLCRCVRAGGVLAFTSRTDYWEKLDFDNGLKALEDQGLWQVLHVSEPKGYLPKNEDFADEIKIFHTLCKVS